MIVPAIALLLTLTALPLFQVFQMSVYDYSDSSAPVFAGLANSMSTLQDPAFVRALGHTLVFTIASVGASLVLGLGLALLLNHPIRDRIRAVFRAVYLFPWLFSSAVVAALWVMMLEPFGLLNYLLEFVVGERVVGLSWLSESQTAMAGVILANVWRSCPFVMLMLLSGLQTIPKELLEAAAIDGAGYFRTLFHIILPQLGGIILTVTTLEVIWNFRTFDLIFIMTGGGPLGATEVLSTYVYNEAFRSLDFGRASAAAIFMLLVMIAVSLLYLRASIRRERN